MKERTEPVHVDAIRLIRESVGVPVLANGDICSLADAARIYDATGVAGVMAARGLLTNPAMFAGAPTTPVECVQRWLRLGASARARPLLLRPLRAHTLTGCGAAVAYGTPTTTLRNHLAHMLEQTQPRSERLLLQSMNSAAGVMDYVRIHYGSL